MSTRNKMTLAAGLMPALCMSAMILLELYAESRETAAVVLWQILPFFIPCLILAVLGAVWKIPVLPEVRLAPRRSIGFVITMSLTAFLLSMLINCGIAALGSHSYYQTVDYSSEIDGSKAIVLLCMVVLPAIFEELFFRGMLIPALSSGGTGVAIFVSALAFALCHGSIYNFAGPFAAGLIYGYMSYALGSVWPAVAAHLINNALSLLIAYVTRAYDILGLWSYFLVISAACLCIFTSLAMSSLLKLVERNKARVLIPAPSKRSVGEVLLTPGMLILAGLFVFRFLRS